MNALVEELPDREETAGLWQRTVTASILIPATPNT